MTKQRLYEICITRATHDNRLELKNSFRYKDVIIPKGYRTNGADIPRAFWAIQPPFAPKLIPAIIVHDFLCDKEQYNKADRYFKEILQILEVPKWKIYILHGAVRVYHKLVYFV